MGSYEQLDRNTGTKWRAVPWNAAERKKGRTRTFDDLDSALAYIKAEEGRLDGVYEDAGAPVDRNRRRVRFAEFAASWVAGAGNEWATRNNYRSHVRSLSNEWPTKYLDEIDGREIKRYLADLQAAGRGPATRAARLTVLRGVFGEALREGLVDRDPVAGIRQAKHRRTPRERAITEEEMWAVSAKLPEWLRPAVALSYDSGLRVGEVCGLRWWAVNLDTGFAIVGPVVQANGVTKDYPKGGEVLPVPLSARTVDALREYRERHPGGRNDPVFRQPACDGRFPIPGQWRRLHPDRVAKEWRRARVEAGLAEPLPRWHDLRHGCARGLAQAGTAAHVMQAFMRHGSIQSTQVYLPAVSPAELRSALDAARTKPRVDGGDVAEPRSA